MKEFLDKITEILEMDSVDPGFKFRDAPDWDSLKGFGILVMLENDYGRTVTIEDFLGMDTVAELAVAAGFDPTAR